MGDDRILRPIAVGMRLEDTQEIAIGVVIVPAKSYGNWYFTRLDPV